MHESETLVGVEYYLYWAFYVSGLSDAVATTLQYQPCQLESRRHLLPGRQWQAQRPE